MGLSNLLPLLLIFPLVLTLSLDGKGLQGVPFYSLATLLCLEKIGAVAPRLFEGRCAAPFGDLRMVSANKNLGNLPATIFGRARVMRKIQQHAVFGSRLVRTLLRG